MGTQAKRAGPEGDRRLSHWARLEAAGPASPRLLFEEVNFSVGAVSLEAAVTLSLGGHRFRGIAAGRTGIQPRWKLAAAATVTAIQQYLHHSATDQPTPEIELRDLATAATGTGQQVIHVTVQIGNGTYRTDSLGSALVRNNWCSAAVAAALDASSRYISRVALASPPARDPPAARELELEQETPAASASASSQRLAQVKETASLAKPPLLTPHVASSAPAPDIALGIEVSPTSIRAAAVDAAGHILGEARRPSRAAAEPEGTLAMIREAARSALADLN